MSNYYKDCVITIKNDTATLNEQLYLYKYDKNIELYFTIMDKQYNLGTKNILREVDADFAQVKWMKTDGKIRKVFPMQPLENNKVHLLITEELLDDDIEIGDYSFQIRLFNSTQDSVITIPVVVSSIHILKPLFDENDKGAIVGRAIVGQSTVGQSVMG